MDADPNQSPTPDGSKRPKRQMKTPYQLEVLEKTYSTEMYPSEATRGELSERLGLTDRQLQMWFCHRRLKDKKEATGMAAMKPKNPPASGGKGLMESPREELMPVEPASRHESGSGPSSESDSGSESGSSRSDNSDGVRMELTYPETPNTDMVRRVIACVEAQLGTPLSEDAPMLGVEFDELPPGAFGAPIAAREQQDRYIHSYDSKSYGDFDTKHIEAGSSGRHEAAETKIRSDAYGHVAPAYLYDSPGDIPPGRTLSLKHGNGHMPKEYGIEGQLANPDILAQPARQAQFSSPPRSNDFNMHGEDSMQIDRKRKSEEVRIGREVQAHEKKIRKELEKQDLLRRKKEEQMKKEMERQDRERRKEEQRIMREQQKLEEKFQREEKREMERREKFMQKELIREERRKQKEDLRKEREAARQRAAMERATARKIAKESMELIEDERLELMELAAASKGLPSMVSLDYDTLQNLDVFRDALCEFPPKSVQLKMPFAIQPWNKSEENVGNLLMVWKFCITFADVLGLWPFSLDEFVQAFHDYDSRLLGEVHISILKLIIKDIEDVVRTPSGGPGTNQYSAVNPEGGHPHIVEGAYLWGFDLRNWQKHLNPSTWPEILRQFALAAGFGPQLKKKGIDRAAGNDKDESKGCEDTVSALRNGSAAVNAVAIMQEKGFSTQRKSRHRLTPGTVKFAAYHVLALEGSKGLNVIDLADKIQKSGLRDLTTSKTPEASISVALSRDPILFERIAPSTYNVRPAFRKDPADAESVIASAKEKIQKFANGFLADQNVDEEERDDDSDSDVVEGAEVDPLATPSDTVKNGAMAEIPSSKKDKDRPLTEAARQNGIVTAGVSQQGLEVDDSKSGEAWVQGLTEGEYSDLSIEERLSALVALIGIANEGNSIRVILEERLDAVSSLKKQMWAEAQLDKRRMRDEIVSKYYDSSFGAMAEGGSSPMVVPENKLHDQLASNMERGDPSAVMEDPHNSTENPTREMALAQFPSLAQQNTERSRMQLKSYIGHRAEEMYVYRSLPLGQDRRRNRYWLFVASACGPDPGSGRIFVESPNGQWRLIDTEQAFDSLITSLDTRGSRESHLHVMLQKIEVSFKECVRKDKSGLTDLNKNTNDCAENALELNFSDAIHSLNSDAQEPSFSFRVDLGRDETEKKNLLMKLQDMQIWLWKECFSPSTFCALMYGRKRCLPLLGICDTCFVTYDAKEDICPSCHRNQDNVGDQQYLFEPINHGINLLDESNVDFPNMSPPRIRLIKALLTLLEVSVPAEAIHSSWTEDCRCMWGVKLKNSSSVDDLLQLLTQFERAIKRDYISSDYETTEELLAHCGSSRGAAYDFTGLAPQLPWIPKTTAAVGLRLLELDASIMYTPEQKAEAYDERKEEALPNFTLKYAYTKDVHKAETIEFDKHGAMREENWDQGAPGSSGYKQAVRNKGGRPRGKSQKGGKGAISQSGKRVVKKGGTLAEILMQQEGQGQKHGRGRRTVRKRRIEQKVPIETLKDYLGDKTAFKKVAEQPKSSIQEEFVNSSFKNVIENDESSNSESDDNNGEENVYGFQKWGSSNYHDLPARSNEMAEMSEEEGDEMEEVVRYDEDGQNLEENVEMNDDEWDVDVNRQQHRMEMDDDVYTNRGRRLEMNNVEYTNRDRGMEMNDEDELDGFGDGFINMNRDEDEGGSEDIDSEEEYSD